MEKTNSKQDVEHEKPQEHLHVDLSVEHALTFDTDGRFYGVLTGTLDESIQYYERYTKGHHTPQEFEQATVLLKSFKAAKNVVSKIAKKTKGKNNLSKDK